MITHEGTGDDEHKETKTIALNKPIGPIKLTLKGGRRKSIMPFVSSQALTQGQVAAAAAKALTKPAVKGAR